MTLTEWAVDPDSSSAPAGDVKFVADSQGVENHELVVIKTDLDPSALGGLHDKGAPEA